MGDRVVDPPPRTSLGQIRDRFQLVGVRAPWQLDPSDPDRWIWRRTGDRHRHESLEGMVLRDPQGHAYRVLSRQRRIVGNDCEMALLFRPEMRRQQVAEPVKKPARFDLLCPWCPSPCGTPWSLIAASWYPCADSRGDCSSVSKRVHRESPAGGHGRQVFEPVCQPGGSRRCPDAAPRPLPRTDGPIILVARRQPPLA
jgi:hypothetical protein